MLPVARRSPLADAARPINPFPPPTARDRPPGSPQLSQPRTIPKPTPLILKFTVTRGSEHLTLTFGKHPRGVQ